MNDYGRYILIGVGIFIFVCLIAIVFAWVGHRRDRDRYHDEDYQMRTSSFQRHNNSPQVYTIRRQG